MKSSGPGLGAAGSTVAASGLLYGVGASALSVFKQLWTIFCISAGQCCGAGGAAYSSGCRRWE